MQKSQTKDMIIISVIMVVAGFVYAKFVRPTVNKIAGGNS